MKLAITSDEHLGKTLYRTEDDSLNKFERKLYNVWKENIDIMVKEKPDLYISCGDSFDVPNPKIIPIFKYKKQMVRLTESNIPSLLIMGNHDFNFKNKQNDTSAIKMVIQDSNLLVRKYAEYNLDYYIENNFLFVLVPFVYSANRAVIDDMWTQAKFLCEEYKDMHHILITHGVTERYIEKFPEFSSEGMIVPNWLLEYFDEIIIGHIHKPYIEKVNDCTIISPGSLINYLEESSDTGPLFLEYDGSKLVGIRREQVETPYTIKITCDETNINEILSNVKENIYRITYVGDLNKIDNDLFTKAKEKAINLVLDIQRFDREKDLEILSDRKNIKDFSLWVKDNYPDKSNLFDQARNELNLSND